MSVTTVSRVLNRRPDVNPATREKVERIIAANNFVGNANARGLKQADGDVVAIILRGRENPFLNALAEAMLQCAAGRENVFMTEYIDEQADEFRTALRLYQEKRVKGFIFAGSRIDGRSRVLEDVPVPMVFATVSVAGTGLTQASSVSIDDRAMGCAAVRHLLAGGHRKIAVFGGERTGGDSLALRYQGVLDAFAQAGETFDESRFTACRFSLEGAYACARAFFAEKPDTTAVFAMSDIVAMGVIRALEDIGRRVPQDVSVFGFDGTEMGKYFIPRLSTVEQPVSEIARSSVEVLTDMLDHGGEPRHVVVGASLRLRESVL